MAEHPPRSRRKREEDGDFPVVKHEREDSLSKKEKRSVRRMKRSAGEAVEEIPVVTNSPNEEFDDVAVTNEIKDLLFKNELSEGIEVDTTNVLYRGKGARRRLQKEMDDMADSPNIPAVESEVEPPPTAEIVAEPEATRGPAQAERKMFPIEDIKNIISEQLEGKAKINQLDFVETAKGLQLNAELDAGLAGGKISLNGTVVNEGNTITVQGLEIKARGYVKSMIESKLSGFGDAIKTHFEKQYGRSVSGIQVEGSGLIVEFEQQQGGEQQLGESLTPTLSDVAESPSGPIRKDATQAESRGKLRELIGKLNEVTGAVPERFTKSKNYLNERAKGIDAQAQTSDAEKIVRRMGEMYNKLNWREKLGIGLVLGAGTVVTGGASVYVPYAFMGAIGVQRAFGMASMYLSQEKALLNAKVTESGQLISAKERAAIDAVMSGAVMGAAIGKGIQLANEYELVERTREWLGGMLGHSTAAPETAVPASAVVAAPEVATSVTPDISEPAAVAAAGEPVPSATIDSAIPANSVAEVPVTMPDISVEATKGHGYEYMMKRVWEQLQDKNLDPNQYAEGSDIRRLLEADAQSVDKVVHQIASDPQHGFFNPDGTSVRIDMGSQMTLNADGAIQLDDVVKAPDDAPTTPVYHPETPAPPIETPAVSAAPLTPPADTGIPFAPPVETEQSFVPLEHDLDSQSPAPIVDRSFVVNRYGLNIPVAEPHIYGDAGAKHLFVYGGTPVERANAILQYLKENPNKVVFAADNDGKVRIPWHLVEGKMTAEYPVEKSFFARIFSRDSFMEAPKPDEFRKLIK